MKIPQYVTICEVKRVCKELGLRDWTKIKEPKVTAKEAAVTVPAVAGSVTPPIGVRVPSVPRTTVPDAVVVAIFPKTISTDLVMPIGVTIVTVVLAAAVD